MEEDDVLKGLEEDPSPKKTRRRRPAEENTTFKPADLPYFQIGDDTTASFSNMKASNKRWPLAR
jgi:hypothetical protein